MASRKCINIYILKYFMAVRKHKHFCTSRGSLYGLVAWDEPVFHFVTVQLVTPIDNRFFRVLLEVPSMT